MKIKWRYYYYYGCCCFIQFYTQLGTKTNLYVPVFIPFPYLYLNAIYVAQSKLPLLAQILIDLIPLLDSDCISQLYSLIHSFQSFIRFLSCIFPCATQQPFHCCTWLGGPYPCPTHLLLLWSDQVQQAERKPTPNHHHEWMNEWINVSLHAS